MPINLSGMPTAIAGLIRQRNIFSPERDIDDYDPAARMRELYQPSTDMTTRYSTALDEMPTRQDPHWARKLLAGVSAFSGDPRMVENALYAPYHRDVSDWEARVKPLAEGANLERQANINMRAIANSIISQEQSGRRLERQYTRDKTLEEQGVERLRQGGERLTQADRRIEQADERLKIAREVSKGGVLKVDDSGNSFIVRKDGTTLPVRGEFLSFEEKEAIRAETATAREEAKRPRVVERIIEDPANPGKTIRVSINLDTGEATPITVKGSEAGPPKGELEQGRGIINRAESIKNSNPRWNKFIKIDKGRVTITRPGIFTGPSKEEYDQMYQAIFGAVPQTMGTRGSTQQPTQQPIPAGKVRVRRKSDGVTGLMDANDPQLNSGKYERIQ